MTTQGPPHSHSFVDTSKRRPSADAGSPRGSPLSGAGTWAAIRGQLGLATRRRVCVLEPRGLPRLCVSQQSSSTRHYIICGSCCAACPSC